MGVSPPPAVVEVLREFSRKRTTGSDRVEREGRGRRAARYGLPSPPVPQHGDTLGGERPRARLMALRGCHGYRGTPMEATPPPRPAKAHLFWKNIIRTRARGPHQGRFTRLLPVLASPVALDRTSPPPASPRVVSRRGSARERGKQHGLPVRKAAREVGNHEDPPSSVSFPRLFAERGSIRFYYLASGERLTYDFSPRSRAYSTP